MTVEEEFPAPVPSSQPLCSCGRSATGFCTGLHRLSVEEWDRKMWDEAEYQENSHESSD